MADCVALISQSASYQLASVRETVRDSILEIGKGYVIASLSKQLKGVFMNDVAQRIAEMLLRTEAIQVYREKPFVFVSGRISPVYIDCRKILSFPEERDYIVTELARKVETAIGLANIDVVAGGETAGIPYASFVSHLIKKPMI